MTDSEGRIRALPIWDGPVMIEPLHGGLSNESFTVTDRSARYVARLGRDFPFHHVFRDREIMTTRAAATAGFAPELVYSEAASDDAPGIMVSRFIDGVTYGEPQVRENILEIAALISRFHRQTGRQMSGAGFIFWVFHVIRDYARTLQAGGSRMRTELPRYVEIAETLEAAQVPLPIVFGHHDLLPANFIHDGTWLWLIDFEYAGFGTPMFDLAGIASNAGFDKSQSEALLGAYFGVAPDAALRQSHAAMQCASLLREAMWSMVSELYLDAPGVDYVAYTAENLDRLDRSLDEYAMSYGKV